ncbi:MAG TPA: non-heme iron oxygenase ferredoxin subunit [Terriglobia bacterium]|nr:non-heme iron oxygenase ferredoxin subunit [Terriglobia bacterium]
MAQFVKVASLAELAAGTGKAVEVNGKSLAIYNVNGTVYATDNACLHQGGPLGEGTLEGDVITCPWHMWQYNVCTGENLEDSMLKVETYPVRVSGDDIEVEI